MTRISELPNVFVQPHNSPMRVSYGKRVLQFGGFRSISVSSGVGIIDVPAGPLCDLVSQRPTGIFHAIRNLQVATRCLGVFTDSLRPIPHSCRSRARRPQERTATNRNQPQPSQTYTPLRPLSQELCSYSFRVLEVLESRELMQYRKRECKTSYVPPVDPCV